ncbi:MAG TPA: M14 metallopeptidase family protein [Gemmatimonadales bacterium]|nr:M14 metallopeptidase family protein [Gemmatimonadales bacterium]
MPAIALRRTALRVSTLLTVFTFPTVLTAQSHLTSPKEQFGWNVGDDYQLATYTQLVEYWKKLASESPRLKLVSIGKTAEGRDQYMMIISSPANLAKLDRYREISARLARAEGLSDEQAKVLAKEGKAVVWIDGGLHASEVLGSHQLLEHVWQMASLNDPETLRILDDVIQLMVQVNPDGQELVASWYMRRADSSKRSMNDLPRLYHKYVGHDDNRDFYMNAMPESQNDSRIMYREWYPQIMYNHHQAGPAGTVMFAPPFRDPHNYFFDPLVVDEISLVGSAMHSRFSAEGKPGVVERYGATYQTWFNGGLRTTAYFHNIVGILTETIGNPTPMQIPFVPDRQLSNSDLPYPIAPQPWHFRQSIDYSITANRAILDLASRYREAFLYNIYVMGRNAIARGSMDTWTTTSREIDSVKAIVARDSAARGPRAAGGGGGGGGGAFPGGPGAGGVPTRYFDLLHRPEDRNPRGYILPSNQPDFLTATKFVNALIKSGIDVLRASAPFSVAGTQYPAGSYVIKTAQAFRPHVLDMLEPQDYPDDLLYPGGPPRPPYDNAGYTLALQMGVKFARILDGFEGPFVKVDDVLAKPPVAVAVGRGRAYLIDRRINDGFLAVNRLLAAKQTVQALNHSITVGGVSYPTGSWYVPASTASTAILRKLAEEKGLPAIALSVPPGAATPLKPIRIGLWDQYGGSMPSGWTRWMFEQFEFPFEVVYPQRLDAGNLRAQFDALVFVDGGIPGPAAGAAATASRRFGNEAASDLPDSLKAMTGRVTVEKTVPQLKAFLEAGGRIVTIGSSTALATHLGLPIENQLVERTSAGQVRPLPREKFYVPASLLEVSVDTSASSALGLEPKVIVMFDESPVLKLGPEAEAQGIRKVAWYASPTPLRSGWAWGQQYLNGGIAAAEAKVGAGTLYLYGPEITFRSQPHGTYKFLFNALYGRLAASGKR